MFCSSSQVRHELTNLDLDGDAPLVSHRSIGHTSLDNPETAYSDQEQLMIVRQCGQRVTFATIFQSGDVFTGQASFIKRWADQATALRDAAVPVLYSEADASFDGREPSIEEVRSFVNSAFADLRQQKIREMLPDFLT